MKTNKPARCVLYMTILLGLIISTAALSAQSTDTNLNEYYRFPVSASAYYQPLAGTGSRELADFTIQEIAGEFRLTLPAAPVLQPFLKFGVVDYAFVGDVEETNQDWSHRHIFAGPGFGYSSRINGDFEIGVEAFAALSQSFFDKLTGPGVDGTMGQLNLIAGGAARLALNPSYAVSVSVTPSARYTLGLGPLDSFNGLTFGVGFGVSYRFGEDPDSAQAIIKSLRFSATELPPAFAAMQSYYIKEPIGSVSVTNTEKYIITDIEISFMQGGFMDSPTPLISVEQLASGESIEVPVLAGFNNQVFTTQGVSPLTGELIASYIVNNRRVEQCQSVTYELHDKNALTWDDDRKAAAFITPHDSAIKNYASFIRQSSKDAVNPYISKNLQYAMQLYHALSNVGMLYQVDPVQPFTKMQEEAVVIDSISLPRETLVRKTGDCDDLTVLFSSLLQTVGIDSALVTTPGHIFCAFDTGVSSADYSMVHPDREMLIALDGSLWVPVEITMIGRGSFMDAWQTGISEFSSYEDDTGLRGFYPVAEAQNFFRPVVLKETDLGLQYGERGEIKKGFNFEMELLAGMILEPYREKASSLNTAKAWNSYGVAAAKLGFSTQAKEGFSTAARLKESYLSPRINLGSLAFLEENYPQAIEAFESAKRIIEQRDSSKTVAASIALNLSKAYYAKKDYDQAKIYFKQAEQADPTVSRQFSTLASAVMSGADSGIRASDSGNELPILFIDE